MMLIGGAIANARNFTSSSYMFLRLSEGNATEE